MAEVDSAALNILICENIDTIILNDLCDMC